MERPVVTVGNYIIQDLEAGGVGSIPTPRPKMFSFLRRGLPPHQTPLAMIGAKPGDRVLFFGTRDPGLVAAVARVTGLNGETSVIADAKIRPSIDAAAAKAGSLVEFLPDPPGLPQDLAPSDVAVWDVSLPEVPADVRQRHVASMFGALRPGGRLLIIDGGSSPKRGAGSAGSTSDAATIALLGTTGAVAARALATVGRVTYYESRRP